MEIYVLHNNRKWDYLDKMVALIFVHVFEVLKIKRNLVFLLSLYRHTATFQQNSLRLRRQNKQLPLNLISIIGNLFIALCCILSFRCPALGVWFLLCFYSFQYKHLTELSSFSLPAQTMEDRMKGWFQILQDYFFISNAKTEITRILHSTEARAMLHTPTQYDQFVLCPSLISGLSEDRD